jgi:hypothetical protein
MDNVGSQEGRGISRRGLVGVAGAGAAAVLTGTLGTSMGAAYADGQDSTGGAPGDAGRTEAASGGRIESIPVATVGLSYVNYGAWSFFSNSAAVNRTLVGSVVSATGNFIVCPVDLPAGTRVKEFTVWGANGSGAGASVNIEAHAMDANVGGTPLASVSVPNLTALGTPLTVAVDNVVLPNFWYNIAMFTSATTVGLWAARIGYTTPSPEFIPVTPYRAYDSRLPGVPSPGVLARLTSRQVGVRDAIDGTGAVATAGVIPADVRAITYNLTVTGTTGDNYLAVAPGAAVSSPASSINFAAGQTLANAATVALDAGAVKVFCGDNVGSAHFIIDVTGYYR